MCLGKDTSLCGESAFKSKGGYKNPSSEQIQLPTAAPHALSSRGISTPGTRVGHHSAAGGYQQCFPGVHSPAALEMQGDTSQEILAPCPERMWGFNIPSEGCLCPAPRPRQCCSQGRTSITQTKLKQHKNTLELHSQEATNPQHKCFNNEPSLN